MGGKHGQRLGREPRDRVVGTIGLGNIASEAIRLLRMLDVGGSWHSIPTPPAERAKELGVELVSLDELLRESDYVLVNCPLTPETRGLMGESTIRSDETGCGSHQYRARPDRERGRAD